MRRVVRIAAAAPARAAVPELAGDPIQPLEIRGDIPRWKHAGEVYDARDRCGITKLRDKDLQPGEQVVRLPRRLAIRRLTFADATRWIEGKPPAAAGMHWEGWDLYLPGRGLGEPKRLPRRRPRPAWMAANTYAATWARIHNRVKEQLDDALGNPNSITDLPFYPGLLNNVAGSLSMPPPPPPAPCPQSNCNYDPCRMARVLLHMVAPGKLSRDQAGGADVVCLRLAAVAEDDTPPRFELADRAGHEVTIAAESTVTVEGAGLDPLELSIGDVASVLWSGDEWRVMHHSRNRPDLAASSRRRDHPSP